MREESIGFADIAPPAAAVPATVRSWRQRAAAAAGIAAAVALAAAVSWRLAFAGGLLTLWLPSGLAVAATVRGGAGALPAVGLGGFVAALGYGYGPVAAALIAAATVAEAALTTAAIRRWGGQGVMDQLRGALALAGGALVLGAPAGALATVVAELAGGHGLGGLCLVFTTRWLGGAAAILVTSPLLLSGREGLPRRSPLARGVFLAVLAGFGVVLFSSDWASGDHIGHALTYIAFPCVVTAALWLGGRDAAWASAMIAVVATAGTVHRLGPFADDLPHANLLIVQVYMIAVAATGLILGAVEAERRLRTRALQDGERTLRRIFEQSPVGISVSSLELRFLQVNEALCRITGYQAHELRGRCISEITHPDDVEGDEAVTTRMRLGKADLQAREKRYIRKDGQMVWVSLVARPVRDEAGTPLYFLATIEDITERKRTEWALAEAKQAAENSDRAKTRFLAATSHDLRQPLLAANLFLESLSRAPAAAALPEVERLRQALTAMGELLDVLLDLSRIDSGIVVAEPRDIRLGRLLTDLGRGWTEVAAAHGLELRTVAGSVIVRTDPVLLQRILRNLLDNAVKYTPRGRILLGCRRAGRAVRIQVWDTGIGIPPEQSEAVFQEFVQLDNPNRDRARGMGIGLSIVQRLAAVLDHPLSVRSWPGRGAMFEVTVPLGARQEPRDQLEPAPKPAGAAERPLSGTLVLVEDDPLVRASLEMLIGGWGARVVAASSAPEAWALLAALGGPPPSMVLADYRLADGWTGIQAVRWLRERLGRAVPAALISGDTSDEHLEIMRASGLQCLPKPVPAPVLRALLQKYC